MNVEKEGNLEGQAVSLQSKVVRSLLTILIERYKNRVIIYRSISSFFLHFIRSSDKIPLVRGRALACIATLLNSLETTERLKEDIKVVFFQSPPHHDKENPNNAMDLVSICKRRVNDEKITVRYIFV